MPANVTHMLIAHKALQTLKTKGVDEYTQFATMLDETSKDKNFKAYMNLGSIGPDLYYYSRLSGSIKDIIKEGFVQAIGVTPWSYHLHSYKQNKFPLKLIEILFSDVIRDNGSIKLDIDDMRKLAYIAGHLTHIAADQIIHPVVNSVAGPYYRSGQNRKKHRECEVFQDYFLYEEVYRLEEKSGLKYDFFKQDFRKWTDCIQEMTTQNTEDWFRYFLQRGFVETYGASPSEQDIENSVDNLLLTLRACKQAGPYHKAAKDYEENGRNSAMYIKYVKNVDYLKYYRLAVELAVVYLIALYEVYFLLLQGKDFTDVHQHRFLNIVSNADLSCPLEHNIFQKAYASLQNNTNMEETVRQHTSNLLAKTRIVTENHIFKSELNKELIQT